MNKPVAIGFTDGITALDELRQRVASGHHDFAIMLAGGLALSRKRISIHDGYWDITNGIDGSHQRLDDRSLWTESHIGVALDKRALLDLDGNEGLLVVEGSLVNAQEWGQSLRDAFVPDDNSDPLTFRLTTAPGAIKLDDDWEPADPSLLIEPCDIGAYTVAQIDLAATGFGFADGDIRSAATSVELTIEDIDTIIERLSAIKQNAIDVRGFTFKEGRGWANDLAE